MGSESRFMSGAARVLLLLPLIPGLTACLESFPVPVGDQEKSRVDPYISGVWVSNEDDRFYVFQPYDKRTWLLTSAQLSEAFENCEVTEPNLEADELDYYDRFMADIAKNGTDCYEIDWKWPVFKVWRTKLGGEWFMTWEQLGDFDTERGFEPEEWMVLGIDTSVPEQLHLRIMRSANEGWDDIDWEDVTSRKVEKVIRKHARDDDFFEEKTFLELHRVLPEHVSLVEIFIDNGP